MSSGHTRLNISKEGSLIYRGPDPLLVFPTSISGTRDPACITHHHLSTEKWLSQCIMDELCLTTNAASADVVRGEGLCCRGNREQRNQTELDSILRCHLLAVAWSKSWPNHVSAWWEQYSPKMPVCIQGGTPTVMDTQQAPTEGVLHVLFP